MHDSVNPARTLMHDSASLARRSHDSMGAVSADSRLGLLAPEFAGIPVKAPEGVRELLRRRWRAWC